MARKLILIPLLLLMVFSACGNNSDNTEEGLSVDKKLTNVEINMPKELLEPKTDEEIQVEIDESIANGDILDGRIEGNFVAYKVTKKQHQEMIAETEEAIAVNNEDLIADPETSFLAIENNSDYTQFNVMVDPTRYGSLGDSFTTILFYIEGWMYQALTGKDAQNITVRYINNDTGEVIDEFNSDDMNQEIDDSDQPENWQ